MKFIDSFEYSNDIVHWAKILYYLATRRNDTTKIIIDYLAE